MPFADRPRHWEDTRRRVLRRDLGICWLCGKPGANSVDHVIPRIDGGTHHDSNLRAAHIVCNARKGRRDGLPERSQRWKEPSPLPAPRPSRWG
jgi:5-methylcytosine-specific restriction endonuclease McrA